MSKPEQRVKYNPWPGAPSSYDPSFCLKAVQLLNEGKSKRALARELGVHRDTLDEWCRKHEQFSDSVQLGIEFSEAKWEEDGRENIQNKEFNTKLYEIQMRNRFGWDKNQNNHNLNVSVSETLQKMNEADEKYKQPV